MNTRLNTHLQIVAEVVEDSVRPRLRAAKARGSRHARSITAGALLAATALSLSVCGSDDAKADGVSTAACDAAIDYSTAFSQAPQDPAEFKSYAAEQLVPIGETYVKELKGDAGKAAKVLAASFEAVAESGDPGTLESPEAVEARSTVGKAIHDECDLQAVDITAVEYAFVDAPDTLKAGRISFALTNDGVEDHEMVLFRRADDATESLDELLALPEEESGAKIQFTGVTFGGPKSTNYVAIDLEPGTYFLVCFLPVGGGEDGPPHFMEGMKETIVVS